MLASGAHVKIDDKEFVLDESEEGHYVHNLESLLVPRQDISGKPGRQNIRPDILLWALDDWSGGEGNVVFDPDKPHIYYQGSGNPRIPGRLTGAPIRNTTNLVLTGTSTATLEGNTLTDVTGSSEDEGSDTIIGRDYSRQTHNVVLDTLNEEVIGTSFVPGAKLVNCNWRGTMAGGDESAGERASVHIRFRVWNVTDGNVAAELSDANFHHNQQYNVWLNFTAIAGKTYQLEAKVIQVVEEVGNPEFTLASSMREFGNIEDVRSADRTPGATSVSVDFYLSMRAPTGGAHAEGDVPGGQSAPSTDRSVAYEVRVFNQTDTVEVAGSPVTGSTTGSAVINITHTALAGKNYRYFVKKTSDTDLDSIQVDKITESTGATGVDAPMAATRSKVWIAFGREVAMSEDGTTWTKRALQTAPTADHVAIACAADDDYLYVLFHENPAVGQTGNWEIHRLDGTLTGSNWTNTKMADPGTTIGYPSVLAMAPASRRLYLLTGKSLLEFNVTDGALWNATTLHTFATAETAHANAGIAALDDNSIVYFHSSPGRTVVYRYKNGVPEPLWYPGDGFTARGVAAAQGSLVLVGGDVPTNTPGIQIRTLRMADLTPDKALTFRQNEGVATFATSVSRGLDSSILIGDNQGRVWIFDLDGSAFSQLDDSGTGNKIKSTTNFLNRRIAASGFDSDTISMVTWEADHSQSDSDFITDAGVFDFDLPEAEKTLLGVSVMVESLPTNSSVEMYYDLDNSGAWTLLGTMTTGAVLFMPAPTGSSTKRFRHLHLRIKGIAGSGAPVVLSATAHATTQDSLETWDLVLRMKNETPEERPTDRQKKAEEIRDWLFTIAESSTIVPFIDGYRYEERGTTAASVNVIVDTPRDLIHRNAEGTMRVRLRRVTI